MEPQITDQPPVIQNKHSIAWWAIRAFFITLFILILSCAGFFSYKVLAVGNSISTVKQSLFGQVNDLLFKSGNQLKGEQEDRINILLLGIGGEGHDGENLTDTIMIASIEPKEHKIVFLSIPRDLYVQMEGQQFYTKLNAVYAYGEAAKPGSGADLIIRKIKEITGLNMNYYVTADFTGFKTIVDSIGGINITIQNGFFDYLHKIAFLPGTEIMNGDRALAYVRARYIEGPEGGDFKRTARQQQMITAIKNKVFSPQTALDFNAINGIFNSVSGNIRTNMQLWEMKRFFELARQIDSSDIKSVVMSEGPGGILKPDTVTLGGIPADVLKTQTGDFSRIQELAQNMFSDNVGILAGGQEPNASTTNTSVVSASPSPSPNMPPSPTILPTIEVRNGTTTAGLARKVASQLKSQGYKITATTNASSRSIQKTVVYTLNSTEAAIAQNIASNLNASSATDIPVSESRTTADILIILGADTPP